MKQWDVKGYPFPYFNGSLINVKAWLSNHNSYDAADVITYPCPKLDYLC